MTITATSPDTAYLTNVAANAVDGNTVTYWQPVTATVNPTLVIDRGPTPGPITTVRQRWQSAGLQATNYTIQRSANGVSWTVVKTVTANSSTDRTDTIVATSARYLRVVVTSRNADGGDPFAHLAVKEITFALVLPTPTEYEQGSIVATHYAFANFPATPTAILNESIERTLLGSIVDAGSGRVILQLDDADAAAIAPGDIIALDVVEDDGTPHRALAMLCTDGDYLTIAPEEEASQVMTWTGPGHLAIFKKGVLDPPGEVGRSPWTDDVIFDYVHPRYDDSGPDWVAATEIETVENAKGYYDDTTFPVVPIVGEEPTWPIPWAQDMPQHAIAGVGSGTTMIVGPSSGTITSAPVGDCFLRDYFTTAYDGVHQVYFTCDNTGELWIDGKQITAAGTSGNPLESGFIHATIVPVSLSAGDHVIAIKVSNWPSFGGDNPIGVAAAIYVPGFPPTLVWESTGAMLINEYPAETPGMTVGTVIRLVLEDQQTLGRFGYISLGFDDVNDTDGQPWPDFAEIASRAGTDVYSFLLELMATYADIEMDPAGWTLNAWIWGTRNPASGVTLELGNLTMLRHRRQDTVANELLVRWAGGWSRVGSGDAAAFLELGPQITAEEVARVGGQAIAVLGNPREERSLTYEVRTASELPYANTNYVPGATVTTPNRTGGTATDRALQIGCSYTKDTERVIVTLTLKDLVRQEQERIMAAIKR